MKTMTIIGMNNRQLRLNGQSPVAIGVLLILAAGPRRRGFNVKQLIERLVHCGVLLNGLDDESTLAGLLQRLLKIGVIAHPRTGGGTRRYVLKQMPRVELPGVHDGSDRDVEGGPDESQDSDNDEETSYVAGIA
jgi:hypothetical protein